MNIIEKRQFLEHSILTLIRPMPNIDDEQIERLMRLHEFMKAENLTIIPDMLRTMTIKHEKQPIASAILLLLTMNYFDLERRVIAREKKMIRLGWFDHCSDSYSMRLCRAKATRIWYRQQGRRISLREAFDL